MIRSMTGFGRSRATVDGLDITVEIRSVNSRYLDCSARISREYTYLEERIKPYLQSRGISRGKVDVRIEIEAQDAGNPEISVDSAYAERYLAALYLLRDTFALKDDISVMTVAGNPDVFRVRKPEEDLERDFARVRTVLETAVTALLASREKEGAGLAADLTEKLAGLRRMTEEIRKLSEADITAYRERLADRIREALADNEVTPDENRLLTECAIHADRVAVDEELVRLGTHFDTFEQILVSGEPVGRRLDFLLQEMNREVNTTGSKCNSAEIARLVVEMKCELEKIREQIQNLE